MERSKAMGDYEAGRAAFLSGKALSDNPYICGQTARGNPKFSDFDAGCAWEDGYRSAQPARQASPQEIAAAASVDVSRFRRRPNRFYR